MRRDVRAVCEKARRDRRMRIGEALRTLLQVAFGIFTGFSGMGTIGCFVYSI
jgi:hypothetical protein